MTKVTPTAPAGRTTSASAPAKPDIIALSCTGRRAKVGSPSGSRPRRTRRKAVRGPTSGREAVGTARSLKHAGRPAPTDGPSSGRDRSLLNASVQGYARMYIASREGELRRAILARGRAQGLRPRLDRRAAACSQLPAFNGEAADRRGESRCRRPGGGWSTAPRPGFVGRGCPALPRSSSQGCW